MNKTLLLISVFLLTATVQVNAQDRSAFRSGYIRLGINKLGDDLDKSISPKQNVFDGRYGAGTGYVFETGRVFYFMGRTQPKLINFGLDWTYLSLNYNKMDKWATYGRDRGATDVTVDGTKIAAAISSKLGPVISFNPIEKLVIDARFQVAPVVRFFDFGYSENGGKANEQYFSFTNYEGDGTEEYDGESVKNRIAFGVATSFGVTLRRKAIGFAVDYISGDVKSNYESGGGTSISSSGKENIPVHHIQFKLSFTL